jgi:NDP-sugar pyrophosphorylase family protein
VEAFRTTAGWADLGTPDRYLSGHLRALDGGIHWPPPGRLARPQRGVAVHDHASVADSATLVGPVLVAAGARIGPATVVGPHVVVDRDARIGAGARLSRSVVLDRSAVAAGGNLVGAIVDVGTTLLPAVARGDRPARVSRASLG